MNLTAGYLLSSLFIGLLGMALLIFGKRSARPLFVVIGIVMCVYPYFISNLWIIWLVAAALLVPVWIYRHE